MCGVNDNGKCYRIYITLEDTNTDMSLMQAKCLHLYLIFGIYLLHLEVVLLIIYNVYITL